MSYENNVKLMTAIIETMKTKSDPTTTIGETLNVLCSVLTGTITALAEEQKNPSIIKELGAEIILKFASASKDAYDALVAQLEGNMN